MGLSLKAEQLALAPKLPVDSGGIGRRRAIHVPGTPRARRDSHECEQRTLRTDRTAHSWRNRWPGAAISGLPSLPARGHMGA